MGRCSASCADRSPQPGRTRGPRLTWPISLWRHPLLRPGRSSSVAVLRSTGGPINAGVVGLLIISRFRHDQKDRPGIGRPGLRASSIGLTRSPGGWTPRDTTSFTANPTASNGWNIDSSNELSVEGNGNDSIDVLSASGTKSCRAQVLDQPAPEGLPAVPEPESTAVIRLGSLSSGGGHHRATPVR